MERYCPCIAKYMTEMSGFTKLQKDRLALPLHENLFMDMVAVMIVGTTQPCYLRWMIRLH